jgi:membrane-bound ClpP family serine protease
MPVRRAGQCRHVILLIGLLVAIFVVPDAWTIPTIVAAAVLEVTETLISLRLTSRRRPAVGVETLVGAEGRIVGTCRPVGEVRVRGETWRARCDAGADVGDPVRVVGRDGLVLRVERVEPSTGAPSV